MRAISASVSDWCIRLVHVSQWRILSSDCAQFANATGNKFQYLLVAKLNYWLR